MHVGGYPRVVYTGRQSLWFAGLGACVSLVLFVGMDTHVVSSLRTGREDEDVWCRNAQREEEEARMMEYDGWGGEGLGPEIHGTVSGRGGEPLGLGSAPPGLGDK